MIEFRLEKKQRACACFTSLINALMTTAAVHFERRVFSWQSTPLPSGISSNTPEGFEPRPSAGAGFPAAWRRHLLESPKAEVCFSEKASFYRRVVRLGCWGCV